MSDQVKNTDRELWRTCLDDFYADSIHVTESGGIGINVGGRVIVKTLKQWHAQAEEIERLTEETETIVGSEAMALSRVIESMEKRHRAAAIAIEWWKKRDEARAIVDGAERAARGEFIVEYGWNAEANQMGYWYGLRGSFANDRLKWAGTSRRDAWKAISVEARGKALTP